MPISARNGLDHSYVFKRASLLVKVLAIHATALLIFGQFQYERLASFGTFPVKPASLLIGSDGLLYGTTPSTVGMARSTE